MGRSPRVVAGQGLQGSVGRSRRRQVTLLELENWQRSTAQVGSDANPSRRRANIVVSGIALAHTRGRVIRVGDPIEWEEAAVSAEPARA